MEEKATHKPASKRQLAYIRQLKSEIGDMAPEVSMELTSAEASELIGKLVDIMKQSEPSNGNGHTGNSRRRINEPRLGMAMKECFRLTARYGWDIDGQYRKYFIERVIRTYQLFTEIAETLESETKVGTQAHPELNTHALEPGVGEAQVA